jgi:hypothetical protein
LQLTAGQIGPIRHLHDEPGTGRGAGGTEPDQEAAVMERIRFRSRSDRSRDGRHGPMNRLVSARQPRCGVAG